MSSVVCPHCNKALRAPDGGAGRRAKCPNCNSYFAIPAAAAAARSGAAAPPEQSAADDLRGETKSCPFCASSIRSEAKKCRFCGNALAPASDASQAQGDSVAATHAGDDLYSLLPSDAAKARAPESTRAGLGGEVEFEGAFTPSIAMLPGERVLDVFAAGLWDLGILGWLFGFKRRLVLTTHRLFRFDKQIIDNTLDMVWLRAVKLVVVGQIVNGTQFATGVAAMLVGFVNLIYLIATGFGERGSLFRYAQLPTAIFMLVIGAAFVILARRKVMLVSTGQDKVGLRLHRIRSAESKRFADGVFSALAALGQVP